MALGLDRVKVVAQRMDLRLGCQVITVAGTNGKGSTCAMLEACFMQAGYRTGVVGKWHLGLGPEAGPDWNGDIKPGPLEIGFDYNFIMAATGDRTPTVYVENHRVVGLDPKVVEVPAETVSVIALEAEPAKFVEPAKVATTA